MRRRRAASSGPPTRPVAATAPLTDSPLGPRPAGLVPVPPRTGEPDTPVADLAGVDLAGTPVMQSLSSGTEPTLLLFLASDCDGCRPLWELAGQPRHTGLEDVAVIVVTHALEREDVGELARLASPGAAVVCSDQAWVDYRVFGPSFYVLVHPDVPIVVSENVAWGVETMVEEILAALRQCNVLHHASPAAIQRPDQATPDG